MAREIEYKFLVKSNKWRKMPRAGEKHIKQGYLSNGVRIRVTQSAAFLTIKEKTTDPRIRHEFEYEIPRADGLALLKIAGGRGTIIDKTRYAIPDGNGLWEVDVFHGVLNGLVLAERELKSVNEPFDRPEWLGKDVTHIKKYTNASLFKNGL